MCLSGRILTGQGDAIRYLAGVMRFLFLSAAALAFVLGSCERHSWEDKTDEDGNVVQKGTKRLYEEKGGDGEQGGEDGEH